MGRVPVHLAMAVLAVSAAGCSTSGSGAEDAPETGVAGFEVQAESATLETWALLFAEPPWAPGQEVKVVWRTTGRGPFDVVAVGPNGQRVEPVSGPTSHGSSNWERPGAEWGTAFRLDDVGDWSLEVSRGEDTARLVVSVRRR